MRPGLSADDIYIMVEDEFHAVAQTFTKHLHHAEYIRLRNAAKERNASTITHISRPVDSTTTMREETRRKKEADARAVKMNAALESIKPAKRAKGPMDESDISDFEEEDKQDDPWQGTHLQRFITTSPKKELTGLTGLQGVISHTRAAAGYSKPDKRPPQPSKVFESARPYAGAAKTSAAQAASDSASETDSDDLDAPSRLPSYPPPRIPSRPPTTATKPTTPLPIPTSREPKRKAPTPPPAKPLQRDFLDMTPRTAPTTTTPSSSKPSKPSKQPAPPDPSPPVKREPVQEQRSSLSEVRQRMKARREREERERRKESSSGIGVDEIPVFLV